MFNGAVAYNVSFSYSNLKRALFFGAVLVDVNFFRANLYGANFELVEIESIQWQGVVSVQDVLLPNRTTANDKNLLINGHADCNMPNIDHWTVETGNINTFVSQHSHANCLFTLQSFTSKAKMWQRVDLLDKWDSNSWPLSQAALRAQMSIGVSIELKGISGDGLVLARQILSEF